ncbi:peptidyl-prolyl cis-trans isomerase [Metabacillus fastidiosus]|uniref:peptidylprolyl isomerase n=1 Tax=Metabacillus fastidiosus TaxID=1458 RepID=A0ABU6P4D2_9BACI|nr:peptidyl-prolyl cis-trans isomerase [Metabacillus fastidiosus]MED4404146.1 peptidyl-prolyl cis-trans isomerase [Metabacillus fastidiosus]MED4464697.1 peptidyl-prolyl cis-trans isomerase [Metabacillus fastidiosus]
MNAKTLWSIIFTLVVVNCFTIAFFLTKNNSVHTNSLGKYDEAIATIGTSTTISREEWLSELEKRFGKETLEQMINEEVVNELAAKHKIEISEEQIDRELTIFKSMYNTLSNERFGEEEDWQKQIRYSILLEELLTKDASVSEEELRAFYESNKNLYEVEDMFRLAHIVVKTQAEANKVIEELEGGSSFEALALEKSIDEFSANEGGEIGFVSTKDEFVPKEYFEIVSQLDEKHWSNPIKVDTGYAIILLKEKQAGISYSFGEVKSQIRRQIALEQMEGSISVNPLWDEISVKWFYEEKK